MVIFLRKIRKTSFFGGRVAAPPLQCLCKQRFFDSLHRPAAFSSGLCSFRYLVSTMFFHWLSMVTV